MTKGLERGEEVRVARVDLRLEIAVQEAEQLFKGLGASRGRAGGEGLRGERGGVKERGEEV